MKYLPERDKDDMATVALRALAGGPATTSQVAAVLFSAAGWEGVRPFPPVMRGLASEPAAETVRRAWAQGALEHGGAWRRGDHWCAPEGAESLEVVG